MKNHGQSTNHHTQALAFAQEAHALRALDKAESLARNASSPVFRSLDTAPAVYRIYTEDAPVVGLVSRYFKGASLFHPTGIWNGNVEAGLIIEIIDTLASRATVVKLAAEIADKFFQDTVIVTWQSTYGFESVNVFGPTHDNVPERVS